MCGTFSRDCWRGVVGIGCTGKFSAVKNFRLAETWDMISPLAFSPIRTHDQVPVAQREWDERRGRCLGRGKRLLLWHSLGIFLQSERRNRRYGVPSSRGCAHDCLGTSPPARYVFRGLISALSANLTGIMNKMDKIVVLYACISRNISLDLVTLDHAC